jgi:alpha-1,2-mannosyltransferase
MKATALIAFGAIVGWPFSAALGIPFVLEQLFLTGGEVAVGAERVALGSKRRETMVKAVGLGAAFIVRHNPDLSESSSYHKGAGLSN